MVSVIVLSSFTSNVLSASHKGLTILLAVSQWCHLVKSGERGGSHKRPSLLKKPLVGVPTFFPSQIPAKEVYLMLIKATTEGKGTSVVGNHCLSTKGSGFLFHYSSPSRAATMV
jgi:hypothetical protein